MIHKILHFLLGYDKKTGKYGIINISGIEFWLWRIVAITFTIEFIITTLKQYEDCTPAQKQKVRIAYGGLQDMPFIEEKELLTILT